MIVTAYCTVRLVQDSNHNLFRLPIRDTVSCFALTDALYVWNCNILNEFLVTTATPPSLAERCDSIKCTSVNVFSFIREK